MQVNVQLKALETVQLIYKTHKTKNMKRIIATMAVIFSLTTSATFAAGGSSVSESVLKSFNKEFSGAANANWVALDAGIYRVAFNYEGKDVEAFFDEEGGLIATGTEVTEDHLPLLIAKSLNAKYADYTKKGIIEFTMDGEVQYLVTLTNSGKSVIIKACGNGALTLYKKMTK